MVDALVLLPNQLFAPSIIRQAVKRTGAASVVVFEDPAHWGDRVGGRAGPPRLRLNGLRVAWMRLALDAYVQRLRATLRIRVEHVHVDALWRMPVRERYARFGGARVAVFDPVDELWERRWAAAGAAGAAETRVIDSPAFLLTRDQLTGYAGERTRFRHAPFYAWVQRTLGILPGAQSTDAENRRPWRARDDVPIPAAPTEGARARAVDDATIRDAVQWVTQHPIFGRAPRPPADVFAQHLAQWPVTHAGAAAWWRTFLSERLHHFGTYQDAIVTGHPWMFHSGVSPFLNIGLLTPAKVVRDVLAREGTVRLNHVEGFVRQVAGWREYCRLIYRHVPPSTWNRNALGATATLGAEWWSAAATPAEVLPPIVSEAVRDAWAHGYLHHIRRLMVVANWMTLHRVHPDAVYHWFHAFALDAWEWVMVLNVYGMGTFADGGAGTRKVYVSSDAYLRRMSDAAPGPWTAQWHAAYVAFRAQRIT
jgi:deoxyribodipyrimidine photolyase-related protein